MTQLEPLAITGEDDDAKLIVQRNMGDDHWFALPSLKPFWPGEYVKAFEAMHAAAAKLGGEFRIVQVSVTVMSEPVRGRVGLKGVRDE
jgi:hypothetical protein